MGKRRFSGLEVSLMVLFSLVLVVAVAMVVLLATGEPGTMKEDSGSDPDIVPECPAISIGERVDCFPDGRASQEKCLKRGCCWSPLDETNVPWCFFSKNHGYSVVSESMPDSTHIEAKLTRMDSPSLFGADIKELTFSAEMQTENRLRFKITDANQARFEVPHEHVQSLSDTPGGPLKYRVELIQKPFGLKVWRRTSPEKLLFDTTVGPLVFADQYLQLSAKLPSHNIYGLGEHVHQTFLHKTDWRTWPIFTRDAFPNGGTHNLYGHYPYFTCLEDASGQSFGVFLMNSNAMEVTVQPAPAITFRTIGGVLDFYILVGETPEAVVDEFTKLIGRPFIPPYWSLGFQISRWDYGSLEEVKKVVDRNRQAGLPYDVQYTDIDYMENKKIFTYDMEKFAELPQFADYMHDKGQKYIVILDPAVSTGQRINGTYEALERGHAAKAWVTEPDGETPLLGEVWPGQTVFPDYTNPACIDWWVDEISRFHKEVKHDALWIDMNEVANFVKGSINGCADNKLNYPPFTPIILDDLMYSKTLCMDAKHKWGDHYDVHSLYGYSMVLATDKASKATFGTSRSMVFTRSSFPGVGKYSGHWLGDNGANWNDIKWAIPGMLEFNLFGVPYIGADICGFFDDSTEELCARWMQVGAFYPFSRNHNAQGYKDQDPASFGFDSLVVNTSRHYLNIRYTLLPYLYTLFYKAHVSGETVVRPVMHEFYSDSETWSVDQQFMWGAHLLITPVLDPGVEYLEAYIPDAIWYDFEKEVKIADRKAKIQMHLPEDKIGLHLRGGGILPVQRPDVTTTHSRRHPMGLIVALDDNKAASGELFWDDGDSRDTVVSGQFIHYQFSVANSTLSMHVSHNGYQDPSNLKFENITVLGVNASLDLVTVSDGNTFISLSESQIQYDMDKQVLYLKNLELELGKDYTVNWGAQISANIDCYPEGGEDQAKCEARGCIWEAFSVPRCYYAENHGYVTNNKNETASGITVDIDRNTEFPAQRSRSSDVSKLRVEITYLSGRSLRWKIFDPENARYEVPIPLDLPAAPETAEDNREYRVQINDKPFGIQVIRKATEEVIWDSALPGFTFSDQFLQISTRLPTEYVYGFGETEHPTYSHSLNFHKYGLFAKDQPPGYKLNSYGVHPFYMGLEKSKNAHGVLLLNSNAMDVTFQPTPTLTYHTIGGILDFYMVMGPTPEEVVQQYTEMIGRPVLPAYWSLGFQLCRYGYANDTEIADLYRDMKAAQIPYDVQYADIDYMERQMDFTLDQVNFKGLPALVDQMRAEGMRFIFILDPAIAANETKGSYPAFDTGIEKDVFIKWPPELSNDIVWGKVWPDYPNITVDNSLDWDSQVELFRAFAAFPDFFKNGTAEWWGEQIKDFYNSITKFDGLWIDMNEPASFVHGTVGENCLGNEDLESPPYMPPLESMHRGLKHKTLCMNSEQILADGTRVKHYDVHNLYGWAHTKPTYDALLSTTGKRGVIVTRSTYPSSGRWAGHWLGDNYSAWDQLLKSIIGMMEFSIFGIPYTGADICGFFNVAEYEMCLRWMQLGAFYPFSRNHNTINMPRQDPVAWGQEFAAVSRDVLNIRYTLLPYLYTLMYEAHAHGNTVVRPLLHEFVTDEKTWGIDRQFLWGPALLITPALDPGVTVVKGYLPNGVWYDYHTGKAIRAGGEFVDMDTPLEKINLHVRAGHILPWQKPETNTRNSRQNPLGLIVALNDGGVAKGSLFWDDGEGIDTVQNNRYLLTSFSVQERALTSVVSVNGLAEADRLTLGVVRVWGVNSSVTQVTMKVNGKPDAALLFTYNPEIQELQFDATSQSHTIETPFTITWTTA
ncbi:LOW QUALITY PROTEIN: sucrase-isomaltase, intestinal-like [Puntigrus tetrazona]|uniref:LOW QUALITY PROTEIN: sucrase-isomaltase, intestinal-like n=1 Tax=Puntigrus tetrazona TaxID=1606681 RepID=UPI001C8AB7BE|nr:LOW QUALITY PROTEIN: sucrase-isomaltase, intestinal-like [Puntigrus tetrazona]